MLQGASLFFSCLAIGKFGKTYHNCNKKAKELFNQYCEHFQVNPQDFEGVELTDFPQPEKYYETQLFAMFLKEDGTAKTLFLSQSSFPTKIYMNVYENHLSLITDHKMYSKQDICNHCDKLFAEMRNLNKHQTKCDTTVEYAYPGGIYKINCLYLRNWRKGAYGLGLDQVEELDSEGGTSWNKVHVPVSFSVGCNLKGVEMVHVLSKDLEELTAKLVGALFEMADKK